MMTAGESSALDGCQHADSVSSEMEIGYPTEEQRMRTGKHLRQAALTALPFRNVLRIHIRGVCKIAFDNDNGYIIVEIITAKIRYSVIDFGHEVLGGQRRTAVDCRGKPLHAEFFAKPVLRLCDTIGIENQDVAAGKVS